MESDIVSTMSGDLNHSSLLARPILFLNCDSSNPLSRLLSDAGLLQALQCKKRQLNRTFQWGDEQCLSVQSPIPHRICQQLKCASAKHSGLGSCHFMSRDRISQFFLPYSR